MLVDIGTYLCVKGENVMRACVISVCLCLGALAGIATHVSSQEQGLKETETTMDCALYTKPYRANEHGAFFLPKGLSWQVMPQYVGRGAEGERIVDNRITMVLADKANRFWPFIAKMSIEEAEQLQEKLAVAIAEKKRNAKQEQ